MFLSLDLGEIGHKGLTLGPKGVDVNGGGFKGGFTEKMVHNLREVGSSNDRNILDHSAFTTVFSWDDDTVSAVFTGSHG